MSIEVLLGELESEGPALLRLAEAVSLAVRVDPPLLRQARRTFVPEADAGAEADLWRSPLVQARGPEGFVFFQEAAEVLRWRLARDGDGRRLTDAWELTERLHKHLSPALLLEEKIAYLSVSSDPGAFGQIENLLQTALSALVLGDRRGLVHWAARALPALPSAVRTLEAARMLDAAARLRLNGDARPLRSFGAFPDWLPLVVPDDLPRISITVRLFEGAIELDARPNLEGQQLLLPETDPLFVELSWKSEIGGERQTVQVTLRKGEVRQTPVPDQEVRLQTLLGEIYNLRRAHQIFISHASADDAFVTELRRTLEAFRLPVWVDSRNLRGGDKLAPEIEQAIETASQVLVVLGPQAVNSPWVRHEIKKALEVEQRRKAEGYRVIPLLLPGITPGALENWFDEEPLGVKVEIGPGGLSAALPAILTALGKGSPTDHQPFEEPDAKPVEDLVLTLTNPTIETAEGKRRATATATLEYRPATPGALGPTSRRYAFTAPFGPIEKDDLRWYLESYYLWPVGVFKSRAEAIEAKLPAWGRDLFQAAFGDEEAREALTDWQNAKEAERRFSVRVDSDLPKGAAEEAKAATREAATELLSLPWELLHDGYAWLFQGKHAVRVRRRLPNRQRQPEHPSALPVHILLVSPRPEKDGKGNRIGYIDHRVSARPLTEAVESLGDLARLTILQPPTYGALEEALQAGDKGNPFDVVHFDGHGVYDRQLGLGGLCFEDPKDEGKWEGRTLDFVDAGRLSELVRDHRVPLVFLEACQTAMADMDSTASVAAKLLEEGVTSVVAMSHSVLVETARRFVQAFYAELATGARVGKAMLAGQQALFADTWRGRILGAGDLRLQDWFVPVLYQEEQDPQLITKVPQQQVRQLEERKRELILGDLPKPPEHNFQGRSRELLALERLLHREPWAVVRGTGGQGKTTLAVELARWLVRTERFERAAFVSLEHYRNARAVLDTLGHQLLRDGAKYSVAHFRNLDEARQPIERALADQPTIVVLDSCESVLSERAEPTNDSSSGDASSEIFALCRRLLAVDSRTRLVFTTREPLPEPFDHRGRERELGALDRTDAIELVSEIMKQNGWRPPSDDVGSTPQEITNLVEAVNCHARALVFLAREVARRGVKATTGDLQSLMADLQRKHPGDRENSLYASVELSLRRLSKKSREHVRVLAVCQGGVHLSTLGMLTGLEPDAASRMVNELIEVGLGEDMGYGHLRLDSSLPSYLLGDFTADEADELRSRWAEAMAKVAENLSQERFKDARLAAQLTLLELPNLLAMLDWLQARWPPERMVELADRVERLVAELGRPQALARATRVREQASQRLGDWSHARFITGAAQIDRLLERGDLSAAHAAAQQLLAQCLAGGETAFSEAAYDTAEAHFRLGRVLKESGAAEVALAPLTEAQRRFQELAEAGNTSTERMAAATLTEIGDCLRDLGRLDEATRAYETAIEWSRSQNALRQVAIAKSHLGTVRLLQKRYSEALEIHAEARDIFETLGEPRRVATAWHQIGKVHEDAGQFEPAEQAYRHSLAISVRENDRSRQAAILNELASLYSRMGRLEEALTFTRQATEIYVALQDLANEGRVRSNLTETLFKLRRYDEARQEIQRAVECKRPFGHAVEIWKTWGILESLERATGHSEAAQAARQQAIETYLAYRRAGGVSQIPDVRIYALVAQAIQQNVEGEARQALNELAAEPGTPQSLRVVIPRLQAILTGERNPSLAIDPELDFDAAAELRLVLEEDFSPDLWKVWEFPRVLKSLDSGTWREKIGEWTILRE